jgi:glycosyltransferase involved in cell wall biosynthesis
MRNHPESVSLVGGRPPTIAIVNDSLHRTGGGVNQVVKSQIEVLEGVFGLSLTVIVRGGDYRPASSRVSLKVLPPTDDPETLERVLREYLLGVDVVFIHNILTTPYNAGLAEAFRRLVPADGSLRRYVAWTHDVFQHGGPIPGMNYVAISWCRRELLSRELGISRESIYVAPNGVHLASLLGLSPAARMLCDRLRLFECDHVAWYPVRLARNKNFELAVSVIAAINRQGVRTKLLIPGVTNDKAEWQIEYYHELRQLARSLSIEDKVVFLTDLRTDDGQRLEVTDQIRDDLYRVVSFLLFTSRNEGFGLPILEAAAHRLPVVACWIPTVQEITHDCGVLTIDPSGDPESIARCTVAHLGACSTAALQYRMRHRYELREVMAHYLESLGYNMTRSGPSPAIGAQSAALYPAPLQGQLVDAFMNGLAVFEVYFDGFTADNVDDACRSVLAKSTQEPGIETLVHAPLPGALPLNRWLHDVKSTLMFAHQIRAPLVTIVLPKLSSHLVGALHGLLETAHGLGLILALENGVGACWSSGKALSAFVKRVKARTPAFAAHVGLGFNPRRAAEHSDPVAFASELSEPIAVVHLSDDDASRRGRLRLGVKEHSLREVIETLVACHQVPRALILEYFYADLARDRAVLENWLDSDLRALHGPTDVGRGGEARGRRAPRRRSGTSAGAQPANKHPLPTRV